MQIKTIEQVDVRAKRVLMRVDFNVPLDATGRITDDRRIQQALPTIRSVIDRGGRLVLMSHCGRPGGAGYEAAFSLTPAAERLGELLGQPVLLPGRDCVGNEAREAVAAMQDGQVVLLENLRFHSGEKKGDAELAAGLAGYGDLYCNDAFGTAHRDHASMVAVPRAMEGRPKVAGLLLQKELEHLAEAIERPQRPFVAVLGGAKVSDKLGAINNLLDKVDAILVGGAMAYTFLKARGEEIGSSRVEAERLDDARAILAAAAGGRAALELPTDHVCGRELAAGTPVQVFQGAIEPGWMGLDIGPRTVQAYGERLEQARTIVWNGPLGVFETPPFDHGTRSLARSMADATGRGATTIVGGGDSAAAVEAFGLADRFSHVSTGGGASLQMLEGRRFTSVDLLDRA